MINIVKEIKINILHSVKFLIRVYKRSSMFAFSLALFVVFALLSDYFCQFEGFRLIVVECSATVSLTCIFLYIFDFVNGIKNWLNRPKVYSQAVRVSVGIPKKR